MCVRVCFFSFLGVAFATLGWPQQGQRDYTTSQDKTNHPVLLCGGPGGGFRGFPGSSGSSGKATTATITKKATKTTTRTTTEQNCLVSFCSRCGKTLWKIQRIVSGIMIWIDDRNYHPTTF